MRKERGKASARPRLRQQSESRILLVLRLTAISLQSSLATIAETNELREIIRSRCLLEENSFFSLSGTRFVCSSIRDTRGKTAAIGRYSVGIDARTAYRRILIKPFVEYIFRVSLRDYSIVGSINRDKIKNRFG